MNKRPYIILKAAMSLDACLDDCSEGRKVFSNEKDRDEVDRLRASCDAILIGAGTLRADNPSLCLRDSALRDLRKKEQKSTEPIKVVMTRSGDIKPEARFFTEGQGQKLIYAPRAAASLMPHSLTQCSEMIFSEEKDCALSSILYDLYTRGVLRLLVEGGTAVNYLFLSSGLVDELRLAIAPEIIGTTAAPRLLARSLPENLIRQFYFSEVKSLDEMTVLLLKRLPKNG